MAACSDSVMSSGNGPQLEKLLLQANAAKTRPLTPAASLELEAHMIDEVLIGATKEEEADFRRMLTSPGSFGKMELAPNAPDTKEVRNKFALVQALMELRSARAAAEYKVKNPPFDSTGKQLVQLVLVPQLRDTTAYAMIYRRTDDNGRPYLLMRDHGLTARDIRSAVQIAARSVDRYGKSAAAEKWISVTPKAIANELVPTVPPGYQQMIDEMASFGTQNIPGVGRSRTIGVWLRIPAVAP